MLPRPLPGFSLPLRSFSPASPARIASGLALALLAAGALNACASGSASGASVTGSSAPTVSASATPSASPTPTLSPELAKLREEALSMPEPEKPELMSSDTGEGALQAAAYFIELYRYTLITGDTDPLEELSDDKCVYCASTIENARGLIADQQWAEPWDQEITEFRYFERQAGNVHVRVDITVSFGELVTHDASGAVVVSVPPESDKTLAIALYFNGTSWVVRGAEVVPS